MAKHEDPKQPDHARSPTLYSVTKALPLSANMYLNGQSFDYIVDATINLRV